MGWCVRLFMKIAVHMLAAHHTKVIFECMSYLLHKEREQQ